MAKAESVTLSEFYLIHRKLNHKSETWADLWLTLFLLRAESSRVICIRYSDIDGDILSLSATPRFPQRYIRLGSFLRQIFQRRKENNPDDAFIFQSKSNRVKGLHRPVTTIAMNMALKDAARSITEKNISMASALKVVA
ncbi:hypothetical protein ABGT23_01880 [Enterobacter cloacae]|uniref:hypothetical protein n=1 Tax=Enterobacter cloacae TaxID=550 RepID=UPI00345D45DF